MDSGQSNESTEPQQLTEPEQLTTTEPETVENSQVESTLPENADPEQLNEPEQLTPKPLTFEELNNLVNFENEEAMDALLPQFSAEWRTYVDAGLAIKRGNPENTDDTNSILNLVHSLGKKTGFKPLALTRSTPETVDNTAEAGDAQGAGTVVEEEEVQSQEEETVESQETEVADVLPELVLEVQNNMLKIEKTVVEDDNIQRKKKKKKRRRKKKKGFKLGLMEFLKEKPAQKVEEEPVEIEKIEEQAPAPKPKTKPRRKRRRKKNKVVDLVADSKVTMKELQERIEFEEKIAVKKNFQMETTSKAQYQGEQGVKAWSGGSGYGSNYTQDTKAWDINTWLVSEEQLQTEIRDTLSAITQSLTDDPLFVEFLTQSCLMNVLYNYCENDSLNDVENQSKLYTEVFECLGRMLSIPAFVPLLHQKIRHKSIAQCVATLAGKFQKRLALEKLDSGEENALASLVISLSDAMNQAEEEEVVESQTESAPEMTMDKDTAAEYCEIMRELCFDSVEEMKDFPGHKYAKTTVEMKRKLMKRLAAEYSDLGVNLPVHEESSVFFRFCEESMSHAQMLIIPPEGTPYAGGCFIFDVCFPASYPAGPPKVNLQTTGRGAVRFNPNLYNCGKVCLSLLGTWGGQSQGEQWNPKLSSFLQVAISIQSLIFVPEPYYNEPGWERYMGTADGDKRSRNYNKVIEKGTVDYAIVEMLENPPKAWEDVINNHFCMQADRVLSNVARWMGEDAPVTEKVETLLMELRRKQYSTGA